MRVAYLINQYPKVSHTFIRREILEMERQGVDVQRFSLRGWDAEVVDTQDRIEQEKTRYTLRDGMLALTKVTFRQAFQNTKPFFRALKAALKLSRNSVRPWPYHLIYLAHACQIRTWLDENPVSHLHAHFGTNSAEVALLLKLMGGPDFSFTIHGMDEVDNASRLGFEHKVKEARFVVTVSAYTRSQLMRHVSPDLWPRLKVVHCGLEPFAFSDCRPIDTSRAPVFLCVGRMSPEKGHLILIPAFKKVLQRYPGARLVMAGDGDMRPKIEDEINSLELVHAVRITGWIDSDQVLEEIRGCFALVQPSFIEGLPVVIMEAMAQERPVISTYVAGIPELVQDGKTGLLVPAGDIAALSDAMCGMIETSASRLSEMGQVARERVVQRHSILSEVEKLRGLFASTE